MPTYGYKCTCSKQFDIYCNVDDRDKQFCECGRKAVRQFNPTPVHFKSRGFPGNDSKKRSRGRHVVDNNLEDLFDDHNYGKKYGMQKDDYKLNKG